MSTSYDFFLPDFFSLYSKFLNELLHHYIIIYHRIITLCIAYIMFRGSCYWCRNLFYLRLIMEMSLKLVSGWEILITVYLLNLFMTCIFIIQFYRIYRRRYYQMFFPFIFRDA